METTAISYNPRYHDTIVRGPGGFTHICLPRSDAQALAYVLSVPLTIVGDLSIKASA